MSFNFATGTQPDPDPMDGFDVEEATADQIVEETVEPPVPGYVPEPGDILPGSPEAIAEEDYAAVMAQVDRRMKVANYFRMVLDHDFFQDGSSEAAIATNRIRRFVREELEVLLGMKQAASKAIEAAAPQFTDEEVGLIRELIARVTKPKQPQLKPMLTPIAPPAPQFKPITAASVVPPPKKPQPVVAAPVQPPPPPKPAPQVQAIKPTGTVDPRIPEQFRKDPTARVVNGKVYIQARTEDGDALWSHDKKTNKRTAVMKDVTPVAKPVGVTPLPMPSIAQSNGIEERRADDNLRMIERLAQRDPGMAKIAGGLLHSLQQPEEN